MPNQYAQLGRHRLRLISEQRLCSATVATISALWLGIGGCSGCQSGRLDIDDRRGDAVAESSALELAPGAEALAQGANVGVAVEVEYDAALDWLVLRTRDVSLATLLDRLEAETGVEIVVREPLQLGESISLDYEGPLAGVFDVLLREFDKVVFISRGPGPAGDAAELASEGREASPERSADASLVSGDLPAALVRAVDTGNSELTVQIVDELVENGLDTEKDQAVEWLVAFVDVTTLPVGMVAPVEKLVGEQALNSSDPIVREIAVDTQNSLANAASERFLREVAALQRELRSRHQ